MKLLQNPLQTNKPRSIILEVIKGHFVDDVKF